MPRKKVAKEHYVYYQMIAGAGAGAITKTSIAPLERIKILFQIQGMKKDGVGKNRQYKNVFQASSKIVRDEGFLAFYKGNGANVLRVIPVYALKFAFNDSFKARIARPGQSIKHLDMSQRMAAGTLAQRMALKSRRGAWRALCANPIYTTQRGLEDPMTCSNALD